MSITWIITGGTISRIGAEKNRQFNNSFATAFLHDARLNINIELIDLCAKFSEEIGDHEIDQMVEIIEKRAKHHRYLITCGTDAMISIAERLRERLRERLGTVRAKTAKIVFTGAFIPYRHPHSDAKMNIMSSIIYLMNTSTPLSRNIRICMHGELFDPAHVKKDKIQKRFIQTT